MFEMKGEIVGTNLHEGTVTIAWSYEIKENGAKQTMNDIKPIPVGAKVIIKEE